MRTTLDVDDDVLRAVKERARYQKKTAGAVISELARRALTGAAETITTVQSRPLYGFQPFARRGGVVTNELIDKLRNDDVY